MPGNWKGLHKEMTNHYTNVKTHRIETHYTMLQISLTILRHTSPDPYLIFMR